MERIRGHIPDEIAGLNHSSMLGFSRPCLVAIDDLDGAFNIGCVRNFEMDGVLPSRDARDGHNAVFEGCFQLQPVQSNIGFSGRVRCDRETQLEAIGSMDADVFPVKSLPSQEDLKRTPL